MAFMVDFALVVAAVELISEVIRDFSLQLQEAMHLRPHRPYLLHL